LEGTSFAVHLGRYLAKVTLITHKEWFKQLNNNERNTVYFSMIGIIYIIISTLNLYFWGIILHPTISIFSNGVVSKSFIQNVYWLLVSIKIVYIIYILIIHCNYFRNNSKRSKIVLITTYSLITLLIFFRLLFKVVPSNIISTLFYIIGFLTLVSKSKVRIKSKHLSESRVNLILLMMLTYSVFDRFKNILSMPSILFNYFTLMLVLPMILSAIYYIIIFSKDNHHFISIIYLLSIIVIFALDIKNSIHLIYYILVNFKDIQGQLHFEELNFHDSIHNLIGFTAAFILCVRITLYKYIIKKSE